MTRKEYIQYINLEIKFNEIVRKYLKKYVLKENETLDNRPIFHSFRADSSLSIEYYIAGRQSKKIHTVSFDEFEKLNSLN